MDCTASPLFSTSTQVPLQAGWRLMIQNGTLVWHNIFTVVLHSLMAVQTAASSPRLSACIEPHLPSVSCRVHSSHFSIVPISAIWQLGNLIFSAMVRHAGILGTLILTTSSKSCQSKRRGFSLASPPRMIPWKWWQPSFASVPASQTRNSIGNRPWFTHQLLDDQIHD